MNDVSSVCGLHRTAARKQKNRVALRFTRESNERNATRGDETQHDPGDKVLGPIAYQRSL